VKRISYWVLSTVSAFVLLLGFDASQRGSAVTATPATISGGGTDTASGGSSSSGSSGGTGSGGGNGSSSSGRSGNNSSGKSSGNNSSGNSSGTSSGTSGGSSTQTSTSTVTGSVAQTQWGPVQVKLTITGGKITKVSILQYPNGNGRDIEIANYSLPILIDETLKSQRAHIDIVSGATYTSTGYVESLQSALDQANL
jgi:uncharacterized protein with FMN-binding domain